MVQGDVIKRLKASLPRGPTGGKEIENRSGSPVAGLIEEGEVFSRLAAQPRRRVSRARARAWEGAHDGQAGRTEDDRGSLTPPAEMPYGEIQKMMALAPTYGFEFVPPKL